MSSLLRRRLTGHKRNTLRLGGRSKIYSISPVQLHSVVKCAEVNEVLTKWRDTMSLLLSSSCVTTKKKALHLYSWVDTLFSLSAQAAAQCRGSNYLFIRYVLHHIQAFVMCPLWNVWCHGRRQMKRTETRAWPLVNYLLTQGRQRESCSLQHYLPLWLCNTQKWGGTWCLYEENRQSGCIIA